MKLPKEATFLLCNSVGAFPYNVTIVNRRRFSSEDMTSSEHIIGFPNGMPKWMYKVVTKDGEEYELSSEYLYKSKPQ